MIIPSDNSLILGVEVTPDSIRLHPEKRMRPTPWKNSSRKKTLPGCVGVQIHTLSPM
jgi:hypothetical protein